MKKQITLLTGFLLLAVSPFIHAQPSGEDFFADQWEVFVEGTPNGDVTFVMNLVREDEELSGTLGVGEEAIEIVRIQEREESIRVFFNAEGHFLNLHLRRVDENNLDGDLVGMFNATGTRIVE